MNANNVKPTRSFYALWIILMTLCVPVAFFIDLVILKMIIGFVGDYIIVNGVQHITEDYLSMFIFIPLMGLVMGLAQYGLLRRYLPRLGGWVFATLGGWLLGFFLIAMPTWFYWVNGSLNLGLALVLMGLAIGLAQWLVLRRRLPRASWWIGANGVGWGLLALITPGNALNQSALFTLGSIPACVTAGMLAVLMNQITSLEPKGV